MFKIQLIAGTCRKDYLYGLTEQEAIMICENHGWEFVDENEFCWDMDYVEETEIEAAEEVRRCEPDSVFLDVPCSMVAVGTAMGYFPPMPYGLKPDGYLSLDGMNRYCRSLLPVARAVSFRRGERPSLEKFLDKNIERAVICVLGHYLYADGATYWSFLENSGDPVVKVWYLR